MVSGAAPKAKGRDARVQKALLLLVLRLDLLALVSAFGLSLLPPEPERVRLDAALCGASA